MKMLGRLSPAQLLKFMEHVYDEAQEGVEYDESRGYSSVQFDTWMLDRDGNVRDSVLGAYNDIAAKDI